MGPENGTNKWCEQVERICKLLRMADSKQALEKAALWYIIDPEYSRSAITQAMHDVEIERGWHV